LYAVVNIELCRCAVNIEPAVKVRGRRQSTGSTSSSEISVADDNTSLDLLHDILRNRDIVRTKVSDTLCRLNSDEALWSSILYGPVSSMV